MFTGIIETVGTIAQIVPKGNYKRLTIKPARMFENIILGESISVDGCCLTVTSSDAKSFIVEASQETLSFAITGKYMPGAKVNLERALLPTSRLGGHFVSGHVDCVGKITSQKNIGNSIELTVGYDSEFDDLIVPKGSIAINGISLTVNRVHNNRFSVNLIPFTAGETTVNDFKVGGEVNLEFDILGKYVAKMTNRKNSKLSINKFTDAGW